MKMIKQLYIVLFVLVLTVILFNKDVIIKSKHNFYIFLFSITSVLTTLYMNTDVKVIEKFEDPPADTTSGSTPSGSAPPVVDTTSGSASPSVADTTSGSAPPVVDTTSGSAPPVVDTSIAIETNFFDENFKDEFVTNFGAHKLKYYISTFDKSKIDMTNNRLVNHVNLSSDKNYLEVPVSLDTKLQQRDGLLINFTSPIKTIATKELEFNHNTFTVMWYAKFLPIMSSERKSVLFFSIPFRSGKNGVMVGVEYIFQSQFVNPSIRIHWGGKDGTTGDSDDLSNNIYQWQSSTNVQDIKFNYFDNNYHLFTLLRDTTGLKLLMDDQDVGLQPLISVSQSSLPDDLKTLGDYTEISNRIRLNAHHEEPTPQSETAGSEKSPEISINCLLNAFAIFNKALTLGEVNEIYEFFQNTKYRLNKRYVKVKTQIDEATSLKTCPFTDKTLCGTNNCSPITDWTNNNELIKNEACYKDVITYCKNKKDDPMCGFFDEQNILKAAGFVNNNLNEIKKADDVLLDEEDLVKQLRKIGLNNIYLDKSLRANGKYANEINELIDRIYKQKQLNVKGINDLYDADSEEVTIKRLEADDILKGKKAGDADKTGEDEDKSKNTASSTTPKRDLSLLKPEDLDYGDFTVDMKKYEEETSKTEKNKSLINRLFG